MNALKLVVIPRRKNDLVTLRKAHFRLNQIYLGIGEFFHSHPIGTVLLYACCMPSSIVKKMEGVYVKRIIFDCESCTDCETSEEVESRATESSSEFCTDCESCSSESSLATTVKLESSDEAESSFKPELHSDSDCTDADASSDSECMDADVSSDSYYLEDSDYLEILIRTFLQPATSQRLLD